MLLPLWGKHRGPLGKNIEGARLCPLGTDPQGTVGGRGLGRGGEFEAPRRQSRGGGRERGESSPPQPTVESVERLELPQNGPGRSPDRRRISVLFRRRKMPLVETFFVN